MKKVGLLFILVLFQWINHEAKAQVSGKITYSDSFVQGITYCPGSSQYNGWGSFRSKLDTSNFKIISITMKGTYDITGRTCKDSFLVRKLAARLKNPISGSDLSLTCGGNTWVVAGLGSCMSGGSCASSADNVGVSADGAASACNCYSPSYQIRPIIGNGNWGGINTSSCPGSSQRMTLEFAYRLYPVDASVTYIAPMNLCSNPNDLKVTIKNAGSKNLDSLRISWSINGSNPTTIYLKSKLSVAKDTQLLLKSGINYSPYTPYTIKVWTSKPNGMTDNYSSNDTLSYSFKYYGTPGTPRARDTSICGSGSTVLVGKAANANDSVIWYNTAQGTSILNIGRYFKTPYLSPGNYKYYLAASSKLESKSIQTNFNGGNQQAGFMLNITAIKNNSIDSIALNIGATSGTPAAIEIYYRDGGYVGYENTPSAWTLLGKYSVLSKGIGSPTSIRSKFSIPAGKTYGLYVQTSNAPSFYLQYGNLASSTTADANLQINTGIGIGLNWGTIFPGRNGNILFYYKTPACISLRDSMTVTIKGKPTGAATIKGSPFNSPSSTSTGNRSNPDIVSVGKALNFELRPPSGYTNAGFGVDWVVSDLRVVKASGNSVPNADTSIKLPTPSTNGKMQFIPSQALEDSLVTIYTTVKNLNANKCDTLLERFVYIAPTPYPNFTFSNVCFGTPIAFKNSTSIKSGFVSYKWDFGNGDSSIYPSPIYTYPKYGTYNVKLTAISNYNIFKDTSFTLTVFEIPEVKFKVFNACMGDSISLVNLTTVNTGTITFQWDLGDGSSSQKTSLKHQYLIPSSYIVTLAANASGCTSWLSKKAHQFSKPIADFSIEGNCTKSDILFINKTTIGLEERFGSNWFFGDGEGNNDANPIHQYNSEGLKLIKYTATSQFGCSDSMSKYINILASPEASFTFGPVCSVKPVEFNNTSFEPKDVITRYLWNFGDTTNSVLKHPSYNFTSLGTKTISLMAIGNNGCSTSIQKTINVLKQPIANFEALDACLGNPVTFTNKTTGGGIINYVWRFGDGDSSIQFSPTKSYKGNIASTYNVTLIAINKGGCQDAITLPVNIKETPQCGFTFLSAKTGGYEYKFIPQNLNYSFYQWNFEGGGYSNLVSPNHTFQSDGAYKVRVYMKTSDGCECLDSTKVVYVNHLGIKLHSQHDKIKFYPNPNSGNFTVEIDNPSNDVSIEVYNSLGEEVGRVEKVEKVNSIDIGLPNGIYLVRVKNGTVIWNQKVRIY